MGVHGPSQVVDPLAYAWQDGEWKGAELRGQVLYELHIGTFTDEGTWAAAIDRLAHLRDVGVTLVEVMPVAEFQGEFGWGYDGVYWFAPTRLYGRPDDFRAFVDHAHELGVGVILDVVYNHFGPTGNYLTRLLAALRHAQAHDGMGRGDQLRRRVMRTGARVRDGQCRATGFANIISMACAWTRRRRFTTTRTDHILAEITRASRAAAGERSIVLFAENEHQRVQHVEPLSDERGGGYGMDGLWNDDFHHSCRVAATGHAEFYYADYAGSPQELLSALRWGYLYQGQWTERQGKFRGTLARHIAAPHFVHFLQNHDQVANSAKALRTHMLTSPGRFRALIGGTAVGAADADAVHGAGVRGIESVSVFRRPRSRHRHAGSRRPLGVPAAVSAHGQLRRTRSA